MFGYKLKKYNIFYYIIESLIFFKKIVKYLRHYLIVNNFMLFKIKKQEHVFNKRKKMFSTYYF